MLSAIGSLQPFAQGNTAVSYGAMLAGCTFFAGYPITPATEIAESVLDMMKKTSGTFIQMEDEIASIAAVIGASWAGAKAMTATSGPGFSLMQENIGYACMTETPCVIVDVQRVGPSTGMPTGAAQGDMMQARWGTHGDHEIIALVPASVQDCLDLTIKAFHLAEIYRNPVLIMTDGITGHMREMIDIPPERETRLKDQCKPVGKRTELPTRAFVGTGRQVSVTGLTHDAFGNPVTESPEQHTKLVSRICGKISDAGRELTLVEKQYVRDAKVGIVSYGITSRASLSAASKLQSQKIAVNHLQLKMVWPFPYREILELAEMVDVIFVPEMNLGQIVHPVVEGARDKCRVCAIPKIGGVMHTPEDIITRIRQTHV